MIAIVSNTETGTEQVSRKSDAFEEERVAEEGCVSQHGADSWCCFCADDEEELWQLRHGLPKKSREKKREKERVYCYNDTCLCSRMLSVKLLLHS